MNPDQILAQARAALAAGADADAVDARIAEHTPYPNIFALRMAVEAAGHQQEYEDAIRQDIAEHPVRSFLGSLTQGASLGIADNVIGLVNPRAGAMSRLAQNEREEFAPGADLISQIGGGLLTPGIAAGRAAASTATGALSGAVRGAARSALGGGAVGAVAGAGFSDPGEEFEGAAKGGLFGALSGAALGAPVGAVSGILGSASGRAQRVAQTLFDRSALESNRVNPILRRLEDARARVRRQFYRPLERQFPEVDDPVVSDLLTEILADADPRVRRAVPPRLRRDPDKLPSFTDLQAVDQNLRALATRDKDKTITRMADEFRSAMEDAVGHELRIANQMWARVSNQERLVREGFKVGARPHWEPIERALEKMTPEDRDFYNMGRLARITSDLNMRDENAVGLLSRFLDAGPDTEQLVASLLPGGMEGSAFQQVRRVLESEHNTARKARILNSIFTSAGISIAGGVIGGLLVRQDGGGGGR